MSKSTVRVEPGLSQEFEVKVWMHQGSLLLPFLFAVVEDVVNGLKTVGVLIDAGDLVLMREMT